MEEKRKNLADLKERADKLSTGAVIKGIVVYKPRPLKLEGELQFDANNDIIWEYGIPRWW